MTRVILRMECLNTGKWAWNRKEINKVSLDHLVILEGDKKPNKQTQHPYVCISKKVLPAAKT